MEIEIVLQSGRHIGGLGIQSKRFEPFNVSVDSLQLVGRR